MGGSGLGGIPTGSPQDEVIPPGSGEVELSQGTIDRMAKSVGAEVAGALRDAAINRGRVASSTIPAGSSADTAMPRGRTEDSAPPRRGRRQDSKIPRGSVTTEDEDIPTGELPPAPPRPGTPWWMDKYKNRAARIGLAIAGAAANAIAAPIASVADQTRGEDYAVGQMSRRFLDYRTEGLQNYRSRVNDMGEGIGGTFEESMRMSTLVGRFGAGTGKNIPGGTFATMDQGKYGMNAAFNLGMDRSQYMSTLETLGRAGAVGGITDATGKNAGGFGQDQKQFAITIAETLASGKLFDRMDEVMQSMQALTQEMSARGATVNADELAKALASANLAATESGSAKLQERAPELTAGIDRTVTNMGYDPLAMSVWSKMPGQKQGPGGFGAGSLYDYKKTLEGGDLVAKSQLFSGVFQKWAGKGGLEEVRTGKMNERTKLALVQTAQQYGMSIEDMEGSLKIAGAIGTRKGQQTITQLQKDKTYQDIKAKGSAAATQLYTQVATTDSAESLQTIVGKTAQTMLDRGLKTDEQKSLYNNLMAVKDNVTQGSLDIDKKSVMDMIAKNELQTSTATRADFNAANRLENPQVAANNLAIAFKELATQANQVTAVFQQWTAGKIRGAANVDPKDVANPKTALDADKDTWGNSARRGTAWALGSGLIGTGLAVAGQVLRNAKAIAPMIDTAKDWVASGGIGATLSGAAKTVGGWFGKIPGASKAAEVVTETASKIPGAGKVAAAATKVAPVVAKVARVAARSLPYLPYAIEAVTGEGGLWDMATGQTKKAGEYYPEAKEGGTGSMWTSAKDWALRHKALIRAGAGAAGTLLGGLTGSLAGPVGTVVGGIAGGYAGEKLADSLLDSWGEESAAQRRQSTLDAAAKGAKGPATPVAPAGTKPGAPAGSKPGEPMRAAVTPPPSSAASSTPTPPAGRGGSVQPTPPAASTPTGTPKTPSATPQAKGTTGETKISNPTNAPTATPEGKGQNIPLITVNDMRVAKMIVESMEGSTTSKNPSSTWQNVSYKPGEASKTAVNNAAVITKDIEAAYGSRASAPVTPYTPPPPSEGFSIPPPPSSSTGSDRGAARGSQLKWGQDAGQKTVTAPRLRTDAQMEGVGRVSAYFESGEDYARVSTGKGDAGGVSYGAFQLSSKTGSADAFLRESGYAKDFSGLQAGSTAFSNKWKEMAKDGKFNEAQLNYARQHYAQPFSEALKKDGIDLTGKGQAVQEMILSTAVHYGAGGTYTFDALKGKDVSKMSDEDIIKTVQEHKLANVGTNFRDSSKNVQQGVANRIVKEEALLLDMAKGGQGPATVLGAPIVSGVGSSSSGSGGAAFRGGGSSDSRKVEISIRVKQEADGKISASVDGPSTITIDFAGGDPVQRQTPGSSATANPETRYISEKKNI